MAQDQEELASAEFPTEERAGGEGEPDAAREPQAAADGGASAQNEPAEEELPAEISALVESLESSESGIEAGSGTPVWAGFEPKGVAKVRSGVPTWPFLIYLFAWIALAALAAWQFIQVPPNQPIYESGLYPVSLLVGITMLALGPIVAAIVWVVSASRSKPDGWGSTFFPSLVRGAIFTLAGAVVWWLALFVVDIVRLGSPF